MSRSVFISLSLAVFVSLAALSTWAATGRHYYTKVEVVEQVELVVDPDDPFADTGLYDDEPQTETVTRDEFHLGLLPVPQSLLDKHVVSVMTLAGPVWVLALAAMWWERRTNRRRQK